MKTLAIWLMLTAIAAAQTVDPESITVTASGGAFYRVYVDSDEASKHTTPHKAMERAFAEFVRNPTADVRYTLNAVWVLSGSVTDVPVPEPPVDPEPEPNPEPDPEPEPEPQPPSPPDEFFNALAQRSDAIGSLSYRDQAEIDQYTVNPSNGPTPQNDSVVYVADQDAAEIRIRGSLPLYDRSFLQWDAKQSGHLVAVWDYKPSEDWDVNNLVVRTHKMFMMGCDCGSDRRMIEQRYHYGQSGVSTGTWQVDTRPYTIEASTSGEGSGLGRITPYIRTDVPVEQWTRFYSEVRWLGEGLGQTYTLRYRTAGGPLLTVYDAVSVNVNLKGGINFFDPTWVNTSQSPNDDLLVHGWLRNCVVLWSESGVDTNPITSVEVK